MPLTSAQLADLRAAIRDTLPETLRGWWPPHAAEIGLAALQDERDEALGQLGLRPMQRFDVADADLADALRIARAERDEARMRVYQLSAREAPPRKETP